MFLIFLHQTTNSPFAEVKKEKARKDLAGI